MRYKFATMVFCSALAVSACSMKTPSQVNVERISVEQGTQSIVLERADMDENMLARIADNYKRTSEGGMDVYVSYAGDINGAAAEAGRLASHYQSVLIDKGVREVEAITVPMNGPEFDSRVIVSFKGYKAYEPKDCTRLTGQNGGEALEDMQNYKIGCENMRYLSEMVSDPRDLLGRTGTPDADARRAGNIVERYRTGEQFEPLDTTGASGIGAE